MRFSLLRCGRWTRSNERNFGQSAVKILGAAVPRPKGRIHYGSKTKSSAP